MPGGGGCGYEFRSTDDKLCGVISGLKNQFADNHWRHVCTTPSDEYLPIVAP